MNDPHLTTKPSAGDRDSEEKPNSTPQAGTVAPAGLSPQQQAPLPETVIKDSIETPISASESPPAASESQPGAASEGPAAAGNDQPSLVPPRQTSAQWKYLPVPTDLPDPHEEYDSRRDRTPDGWTIVGARVRGKKHKHEGTNCDDWFEFAVAGPWLLIAVSDGAGSKHFSRIGARASCQAAVEHLREALRDVQLQPRQWTDNKVFAIDDNGDFAQADLRQLADALHRAMQAAQQAVQEEFEQRRNKLDHYKALGNRDLEINDLLATLMLAVQTRVLATDGAAYDLIMGCSVGDGMMATIDKTGKTRLLLNPDSGQFSGETEFLTEKAVAPARLKSRIRVVFGSPQRALLAMTDGVADDYFPNNPGMSRLYGDLVLNGIISLQQPPQEETVRALRDTGLSTLEAVEPAGLRVPGEMLTAQGIQPVGLNSAARYAERLGVSLEQVVASPALLLAGRQASPVLEQEAAPEARLRLWLEAYQVRGSFDDRTLVVAYRKAL